MDAADGATVTVATGTGVIVTTEEPCFPSDVAVIVADPGATPVTTPVELTVALLWSDELQVTARSFT